MAQEPLPKDLFEQHREDTLNRLSRIERKIDNFTDHRHREHPSWAQLVTLLISAGGGLLVLLG